MHQHFLTDDFPQVAVESTCVYDMCIKACDAMYGGDFYKAEQYLIDAIKSVNELKRMQDKKKSHESLVNLVSELDKRGVTATVVRRMAANE